jgi:hypothetical protein
MLAASLATQEVFLLIMHIPKETLPWLAVHNNQSSAIARESDNFLLKVFETSRGF